MWIAITIIAAISLALLSFGMRDRRVDDHLHCRRCGFDLTGLPTGSSRCPECGRDITRPSGVRIGRRKRRWPMTAAGLFLLLATMTWSGVLSVRRVREVGWLHYVPTWVLTRQIDPVRPMSRGYYDEILFRLQNKQLSNGQIAAITDRFEAAAINPTASPATRQAANCFIELAHAFDQLPKSHWASYAKRVTRLSLRTRPIVRQDDPLPALLDVDGIDGTYSPLAVVFELNGRSIDGSPLLEEPTYDSVRRCPDTVDVIANNRNSREFFFESAITARLTPGVHHLRGALHARVFDKFEIPPLADKQDVIDLSRCIVEWTQPFDSTFEIFDAEHEPPLYTHDSKIRAAIARELVCNAVDQTVEKDDRISVDFFHGPLLVPICFTVSVRPARSERWTFNDPQPHSLWSIGDMHDDDTFELTGDLGNATAADVKLSPSPSVYRDSVDWVYVWGEEIVFHDVPVTHLGLSRYGQSQARTPASMEATAVPSVETTRP